MSKVELFKSRLSKALHTPVYVYQMGKVGSTSLEATIESKTKGVFARSHYFYDMPVNRQKWLVARLKCHMPVNVICPIREPISRNVSAFFQNFTRDTGLSFTDQKFSYMELKQLFLDCYPHNIALEWFDRNMKPFFGLDVYQEAFPIEKKWAIYQSGSARVLVYRSDLDRHKQLDVVSDFLKLKLDGWVYGNVAEDKEYKELYKAFCSSVDLPEVYLKMINGSSYAKQFWSECERESNANRWRGKEIQIGNPLP